MRKIDTSKLVDAETVLTDKYGAPGTESRREFEAKHVRIITVSFCVTGARN